MLNCHLRKFEFILIFNNSIELLALLFNLLWDFSIKVSNHIVDVVQVSLDQQLKIRVLHLAASITGAIHIAIEIPAIWNELVEKLFLQSLDFFICHVLSFLQGFSLLSLRTALLHDGFENVGSSFDVASIGEHDTISVHHSTCLIAQATETYLISCND